MKSYQKWFREATAKEAIPHLAAHRAPPLKASSTRSVTGTRRISKQKHKQTPLMRLLLKWGKWAFSLRGRVR